MKVILASVVFALPPAGTTMQPEVVSLIPEIVSIAQRDAEENSRPGSITGPLLIDIRSFAAAIQTVTDTPIPRRTVVAAVGREFRQATQEEAVHCQPQPRKCWVADDGLFVRLETLVKTETGYTATITSQFTDRRPSGSSATGTLQFRLSFAPEGAGWSLIGQELIRIS